MRTSWLAPFRSSSIVAALVLPELSHLLSQSLVIILKILDLPLLPRYLLLQTLNEIPVVKLLELKEEEVIEKYIVLEVHTLIALIIF